MNKNKEEKKFDLIYKFQIKSMNNINNSNKKKLNFRFVLFVRQI